MSMILKVAVIALLLWISSSDAARSQLGFHGATSIKAPDQEGVEEEMKKNEEGYCDVDDDECVMNKTGIAHLDYIYTQKLKP